MQVIRIPVILTNSDFLVPIRTLQEGEMYLSPPIKIHGLRLKKPWFGPRYFVAYVDEQLVKIHESDISHFGLTFESVKVI